MSPVPELVRPAATPAATAAPIAPKGGAGASVPVRAVPGRLGRRWLPRAAWAVRRTGRAGLAGLALLAAAAVFLVSTHLPVASDVRTMREELASSRGPGRPDGARGDAGGPAASLPALPSRAEVPSILRQIFALATQARLSMDSGKYEVNAARGGGVVRYLVAFPVSGPYPQIRSFVDQVLATLPAVALGELTLERKAISEGEVEAQIRLVVYTSAAEPAAGAGSGRAPARAGGERERASEASPGAARVVSPVFASALFAQHSWYVLPPAPPPPPPAAPPPEPEPTAPPLPYAFLGSFSPDGEAQVFFLSRGDRVIDARVGDKLDGVYKLESAAGGQLVFVYLPLNVRQTLAAGVTK